MDLMFKELQIMEYAIWMFPKVALTIERSSESKEEGEATDFFTKLLESKQINS